MAIELNELPVERIDVISTLRPRRAWLNDVRAPTSILSATQRREKVTTIALISAIDQ